MVVGILLAAGSSSRMGENKLLMNLAGQTPLELSYNELAKSNVAKIIIVVSDSTKEYATTLISSKPTDVIMGGGSRNESVYNALAYCKDASTVVIHDAARCLVTYEIINECIDAAIEYGSAVTALPMRDTTRDSTTHKTVDRNSLLLMQTPQAFAYKRIKWSYEILRRYVGVPNTDDCGFYVNAGFAPHYITGNVSNQKLTYPEDKEFFEAVILYRQSKRNK